MPVISYIKDANSNKNNNENEGKENIKKEEIAKTAPTATAFMVATPFFINNISSKYYFNNFVKKTTKPFAEREGDWICPGCKNLNFAFRLHCNRCKLPKENSEKKVSEDKKEENLSVKKEEMKKEIKENDDIETIKVSYNQPKKSKHKSNKHKKGHNKEYEIIEINKNTNKRGENKKE